MRGIGYKRERRSGIHAARDERRVRARRHERPIDAIGIEAEFVVRLDGRQVRPEEVFGSPRHIVRQSMMHRTGRSYHLPTGDAMYFDTGVIELATPLIEIAPGCAARAGRSLWESIGFVRQELDAWEQRHGRGEVQLVGFSTHYNVSFHAPASGADERRSVEKLALLLTYLLPAPVMLLAANRRSTGIGVRPRVNRVEVTADFTPDAALMIATATVIVGIVRAVMTWPNYELSALAGRRGLPLFDGFGPVPHSSRKGWVARASSYRQNPFMCDVNRPLWRTRGGPLLSLRQIAERTTRYFRSPIQRLADPLTFRLIGAVMSGRTPSLLELQERPPAYESVGRLCTWDDLFSDDALPRSRYERVLARAIHGDRLQLDRDDWYVPTGMQGWSHVVFRRERDRTRHVFSLDYLSQHLGHWAPADR
ncbi:MAG TPA: hypothetical protein VJU87_12115 [Gemmatimonadaceae bacterium]|nr:hypothetical protein [Gemmatimonadaceae bacterium]